MCAVFLAPYQRTEYLRRVAVTYRDTYHELKKKMCSQDLDPGLRTSIRRRWRLRIVRRGHRFDFFACHVDVAVNRLNRMIGS